MCRPHRPGCHSKMHQTTQDSQPKSLERGPNWSYYMQRFKGMAMRAIFELRLDQVNSQLRGNGVYVAEITSLKSTIGDLFASNKLE